MDLALAQRICRELQNGNNNSVGELVRLYGTYLKQYAEKRLRRYGKYITIFCISDSSGKNETFKSAEDLLQSFWIDVVIVKKIVCDYEARNNASLKSFLVNVLFYHIEGYFRNVIRCNEVLKDPETLNIHETPDELSPHEDEILLHLQDDNLLDDAHQHQLIKMFVNTALERLSVIRPNDARLVLLRMKGLSYKEIALRYVSDPKDGDALRKQESLLRQQCTRQTTGSYSRFVAIFNSVIEENGYLLSMIDNKPKLEKKLYSQKI